MPVAQLQVGEPIRLPAGDRPQSLPDLIHRSVERYPNKTAIEWKEGRRAEAWNRATYAELWAWMDRVAAGLRALGLERHQHVAILSRSRPEWLVSDLAALSLGAVTCPIYPAEKPGQVEFILRNVEARFAFVENAQQAAKVVAVRDRLPALEHVIAFEADAPADGVMSLDQLVAAGRAGAGGRDGADPLESSWRTLRRDDVATIVHTSGTTGEPKGVVLTHGNVIHNYEAAIQAVPFRSTDLGLSVLPLSHMMERAAGMIVPLGVGASVAFAEPLIARWAQNLADVRPTVMVTVPPFFARIHQQVLAQVERSAPWKQRLFHWAVGLGRKRYALHLAGRRESPWLRLQLGLAHLLVFRPIKARTGGRLRFFCSGAAPLPREIGEFFYAMGMLILEGYGLSETAPLLCINRPESFKFGSVGQPVAETAIRIDPETGEICARGPQVMRGYLNLREENERAIDADGWFHTGDIGEFDEAGRLMITDRIKNLLVLANGKKVSPGPMETALAASPYIAQAVILGDGHEYTGVLVAPDHERLTAWAASHVGDGSPGRDLTERSEVKSLIEGEVRRLLADHAAYERPRRVGLLPRELSEEEGELTPMRKPKRRVIAANFPDEIARLFEATAAGAATDEAAAEPVAAG